MSTLPTVRRSSSRAAHQTEKRLMIETALTLFAGVQPVSTRNSATTLSMGC